MFCLESNCSVSIKEVCWHKDMDTSHNAQLVHLKKATWNLPSSDILHHFAIKRLFDVEPIRADMVRPQPRAQRLGLPCLCVSNAERRRNHSNEVPFWI